MRRTVQRQTTKRNALSIAERASDTFEQLSSAGLLLRLHAVPPRTDAGHLVEVAFKHLHRLAQTRFGRLDAELARLLALLRRHPPAVVAPQARPELALERLPGRVLDALRSEE